MRDLGHDEADKEIKRVERQLRRIYSQAAKDIEAKMEDFNKKYDAKYQIHLQEYKDGKITKADFDAWVRGQVFQREQWQAKRDQIVDVIHNSNKAATNIVNNSMYGTFAFNSNYQAYQIEKGFGTNFGFGLYDAKTVSNLVQNDPQILPKWKINKKKDYRWNYRKVNDAITQGIIQGESLDKITKRLSEGLCAQNENTMKTFARTGMTQAQNAGRYQRQLDAKKMGINMKKEWMATLDNRTRHSHARLDGEKVDIDDDVKFSNGCRYPGDPEGPPREIYNCRCTLVADLVDFPSEYQRYDNIDGRPTNNMTYAEWAKAKSGVVPTVSLKPEFSVSDMTRRSITPESASEDWFEYENANVMREYIETGEMPMEYMFSGEIDRETRERLAAEAELMQNIGATTKTNFKTLYRGMVLDEDDARSMFTPGEQYTFNTLSATTSDRGIAKIYMDPENAGGEGVPVILEIQKSDGIYGFDRDGSEIVIPKGSEFRVVKNWMDENGIVHISLYAKKGKNVK